MHSAGIQIIFTITQLTRNEVLFNTSRHDIKIQTNKTCSRHTRWDLMKQNSLVSSPTKFSIIMETRGIFVTVYLEGSA
jgi:hypothetical protein